MCIVFAITGVLGFKAIVAGNRDEFLLREAGQAIRWNSLCPRHQKNGDKNGQCCCGVVGGYDLEEQSHPSAIPGTWAAVNQQKARFSCVTNIRKDSESEGFDPNAISRGTLISKMVVKPTEKNDIEDIKEALECIDRDKNKFNGFNIIAGDLVSSCNSGNLSKSDKYILYYTGNRGSRICKPHEMLQHYIPYVVSNEEMPIITNNETSSSDFPKVEHGRDLFSKALLTFYSELNLDVQNQLCKCGCNGSNDNKNIKTIPHVHFYHGVEFSSVEAKDKECNSQSDGKNITYSSSQKERLVELLLNVLQNNKQFKVPSVPSFEDEIAQSLSSICVPVINFNNNIYGTRTHTILLVDSHNRVTYIEVERLSMIHRIMEHVDVVNDRVSFDFPAT